MKILKIKLGKERQCHITKQLVHYFSVTIRISQPSKVMFTEATPRWTSLFSGLQILMLSSKECINCIMCVSLVWTWSDVPPAGSFRPLWKWNILVSVRPFLFNFMGYLRKNDKNSNSPHTHTHTHTHTHLYMSPFQKAYIRPCGYTRKLVFHWFWENLQVS